MKRIVALCSIFSLVVTLTGLAVPSAWAEEPARPTAELSDDELDQVSARAFVAFQFPTDGEGETNVILWDEWFFQWTGELGSSVTSMTQTAVSGGTSTTSTGTSAMSSFMPRPFGPRPWNGSTTDP